MTLLNQDLRIAVGESLSLPFPIKMMTYYDQTSSEEDEMTSQATSAAITTLKRYLFYSFKMIKHICRLC